MEIQSHRYHYTHYILRYHYTHMKYSFRVCWQLLYSNGDPFSVCENKWVKP